MEEKTPPPDPEANLERLDNPLLHKDNSKKFKIIFLVFIVIFLLTLATAAGIFFYKDYIRKPVTKLVPPSSPTPTISLDSTANWVEFVAEGFTIKHPSDWVLGQSKDTEELYMYFSKTAPADSTNNIMSLSVQDIDIERSTRYLNTGDAGMQNSSEVTHDTFNGVKIVKAVSTFSQLDSTTGTYISEPSDYVILLPLGDKTIRLSSLLEDKDTLDQVLSTLKFTDVTDPPSFTSQAECEAETEKSCQCQFTKPESETSSPECVGWSAY